MISLRTFLIALIIAVIAISVGIFVWLDNDVAEPGQPIENPGTSVTPSLGTGALPAPSSENNLLPTVAPVTTTSIQIAGFWINSNDDVFTVSKIGGAIFKNNEPIFQTGIRTVHEVIPSNSGLYALISFDYPQNTTYALFDSASTTWASLPRDIAAATWSPSDDRIAYINGTSLSIFNPRTGRSEKITDLAVYDTSLFWYEADSIAILERSMNTLPVSLYSLSIKNKKIESLLNDTIGLSALFSPGSPTALLTTQDGAARQASMWQKGTYAPISDALLVIPEKCSFAGTILYCAAPYSHTKESFSIEKYLKGGTYTLDKFMRIEVTPSSTVRITELAKPLDLQVDATALFRSKDLLYFKNRYDNRIYSIPLN